MQPEVIITKVERHQDALRSSSKNRLEALQSSSVKLTRNLSRDSRDNKLPTKSKYGNVGKLGDRMGIKEQLATVDSNKKPGWNGSSSSYKISLTANR